MKIINKIENKKKRSSLSFQIRSKNFLLAINSLQDIPHSVQREYCNLSNCTSAQSDPRKLVSC